MDLRVLTKLVLKLVGLYLLINAVIAISSEFVTPSRSDAIPHYVTLALYVLVGVALVWFPGTIATRVLRIEGAELDGPVTASKLLSVGLALLGANFFIAATYSIIYTLAASRWFYRVSDTFAGARGPEMGPTEFATIVAGLVQIAIGAALWFGRHKLSKLPAHSGNDR